MPAPSDQNLRPMEDQLTVYCLYCMKPQIVGRRAMSITCKHCHKPLKLEDIAIKDYQARRVIATCGVVTIEKKGNAVTDKIQCGGLIVRGKVKGAVESNGPVLVGPDAEVKGNVTAPTLAVGAGAVLEGHYEIGPKDDHAAGAAEGAPPRQSA